MLGSRGWRRKIRRDGRIYIRLSGRDHDKSRLKSSSIPHMRSLKAWGSLRSELRTCRNLRRIWSRAAKLTIRDRFRSIGVNTFLLCGFSEQSETMGGCLDRRGFASHIHIVDSYLHHGAHAGCSDSEEVPATYIYIRRRCRATTGAPSHCVALLAKATKQSLVSPIGQNCHERRALPRGKCRLCFSAISVNLEPCGKDRHFRRFWPYGAIRTCLTTFASSLTR